ncbi:hypothetical protein GGI11_008440 [Coemansia sp. RSA 2049]|nr:hypothetical protein GGI11_008440 [Coemansia sp. RSA 2049]
MSASLGKSLDMSLDDIINENKKSRGPRNQNRNKPNTRGSPYTRRNDNNSGSVQKRGNRQRQQQQQAAGQSVMFNPAAFLAAAQQQNQTSRKIVISNLYYGVTEKDLRALFEQVGPISSATLNCKGDGTSRGSGEVVFKNPMHARLAIEKYNGVHLDGRAMKIETTFDPMAAAASMMMPTMVPSPLMMQQQQQQQQSRNAGGSSGSAARNKRGGNAPAGGPRRNARGSGRRGNNPDAADASVTKDSLDAELDSYMLKGKEEDTAMAE